MGVYIDKDISTTFEGDINLSDSGDLGLANALDTYKSVANFLLRTDYGDYAPNITVGCNIGSYIGQNNTKAIQEQLEYNVNKVLQTKVFSLTDARADVVPFDVDEVICIISIAGSYLIDGQIQYFSSERIAYTFPYIEERNLTPIDIS